MNYRIAHILLDRSVELAQDYVHNHKPSHDPTSNDPWSSRESFAYVFPSPLATLIELLGRVGRHDDIMHIIHRAERGPFYVEMVAEAIRAFVSIGKLTLATQLVTTFDESSEKALALAKIGEELASNDPAQAKKVLNEAGQLLWESSRGRQTLRSMARAVNKLPAEMQRSIVLEIFQQARTRDRLATLATMEDMTSVMASLMDAKQWKYAVKRVWQTEQPIGWQEAVNVLLSENAIH